MFPGIFVDLLGAIGRMNVTLKHDFV